MSARNQRLAIAACLLVAVAIGMLVAEFAPPAAVREPPEPRWVRTSEGWIDAFWDHTPRSASGSLHPLVLAAFISLASATALVALSRQPR